jgi:hypothetical protein
MRGHASRDVNTDGRNFARRVLSGPNAREAGNSLRLNSEIRACTNENFFQSPHILDGAQRFALAIFDWDAPQIKDGITHELPGAVKRNIAAAIAFEDLHAALRQMIARRKDVLRLRVASERDHGRVFQQEKDIADSVVLAQVHQLLLKPQAAGVVDRTELDDGDHCGIFLNLGEHLGVHCRAYASSRAASFAK